jgi:ABC-2 type transport system permease protein
MNSHASLLPAGTPRSAFGKLLTAEARYQWRVPVGLIFGIGVPLMLVIIFGLIPAANTPDEAMGGRLTIFGWFFPSLLTLALITLSLVSLPEHLADYRQQGILRRMGTTPVPPAWMLAAQVAINLALAVAALVILVVAGTVGFGLGAPSQPGGFTLALALTIAAMFAIGLWISAIARTQSAANGIGQLLLWPMFFFAGLLFPRPFMPAVLRDIADWTPSGAAVHAMTDSMLGTFPSAQLLLVLAGWALVFGFLAVRFFRWE